MAKPKYITDEKKIKEVLNRPRGPVVKETAQPKETPTWLTDDLSPKTQSKR
jgi:hypothetical protein